MLNCWSNYKKRKTAIVLQSSAISSVSVTVLKSAITTMWHTWPKHADNPNTRQPGPTYEQSRTLHAHRPTQTRTITNTHTNTHTLTHAISHAETHAITHAHTPTNTHTNQYTRTDALTHISIVHISLPVACAGRSPVMSGLIERFFTLHAQDVCCLLRTEWYLMLLRRSDSHFELTNLR